MTTPLPEVGQTFTCRYPFVRCVIDDVDMDSEGVGVTKVASWRPGTEGYNYRPGYEDEIQMADGAGELILTVVSVHKPGRFPTRVFFTRQWKSPDGKVFGKSRLHMVTADKFRRISTRYQQPWGIEDRGVEAVMAGVA